MRGRVAKKKKFRYFICNIFYHFKDHFVLVSPGFAKNCNLSSCAFKDHLRHFPYARNLNSQLPKNILIIPLALDLLRGNHLKCSFRSDWRGSVVEH